MFRTVMMIGIVWGRRVRSGFPVLQVVKEDKVRFSRQPQGAEAPRASLSFSSETLSSA
jgi:hypothetical protein